MRTTAIFSVISMEDCPWPPPGTLSGPSSPTGSTEAAGPTTPAPRCPQGNTSQSLLGSVLNTLSASPHTTPPLLHPVDANSLLYSTFTRSRQSNARSCARERGRRRGVKPQRCHRSHRCAKGRESTLRAPPPPQAPELTLRMRRTAGGRGRPAERRAGGGERGVGCFQPCCVVIL